MKPLTLSSLACLSFSVWLSHAAPVADPVLTSRPSHALGIPYPTPTTNEFRYQNYDENKAEDKDDRLTVHSAFLPFAQILQAAISAVGDTSDDTYKRWFPGQVNPGDGKPIVDGRSYVQSVYRQLLVEGDQPIPHPGIARFVHYNNDFAVAGQGCKDNTRAYMNGETGEFHICKPKGLVKQPTITDKANCPALGTQVSSKMDSLTGTLIHEFMHWYHVAQVDNSAGHITDVIYGASNCMRLARGRNQQRAFFNADSYKWLALNAYYNKLCDKKFGDPAITKEDWEAGTRETMDSREYNPDLTSGALAGA